jgi:putative ABC transport system ATP-binding protein
MIRAESVSKVVKTGQDSLTILDNIDLSIDYGESVAIVGASGSGKTTLLGLLAGLDLPTSGHIYLNGSDITVMNEEQRAVLRNRNVGFVFQSFQLLPALTAVENVAIPLELRGEKNSRQRALE